MSLYLKRKTSVTSINSVRVNIVNLSVKLMLILAFGIFLSGCSFDKEDVEDCYGCEPPQKPIALKPLSNLTGIRTKTVTVGANVFRMIRELSGGSCYDRIEKNGQPWFKGHLEKFDGKTDVVVEFTGAMFLLKFNNSVVMITQYQKADTHRGITKSEIYIEAFNNDGSLYRRNSFTIGGVAISKNAKPIGFQNWYSTAYGSNNYYWNFIYATPSGSKWQIKANRYNNFSGLNSYYNMNFGVFDSWKVEDLQVVYRKAGSSYKFEGKFAFVDGKYYVIDNNNPVEFTELQNTTLITAQGYNVAYKFTSNYKLCKKGQTVVTKAALSGNVFSIFWNAHPKSIKVAYNSSSDYRTVQQVHNRVIIGRKYTSTTQFVPYIGLINIGWTGIDYFDSDDSRLFSASYMGYDIISAWKYSNYIKCLLYKKGRGYVTLTVRVSSGGSHHLRTIRDMLNL